MLQVCRVPIKLCGVVFLFGFLIPAASAQRLQPRLTQALAGSPRSVLAHSRSPRVRSAEDLGAVPADMPVTGITLAFRRTAVQEAALQQLLVQLQTPGSLQFHRWLTPDDFASRFGVADPDITAVEKWLTDEGFHVDSVSRSRDHITLSGTAVQVQRAFGAELHRYRVDGATHFAPASDLMLPAELGAMTAAVLHLSDFRPSPLVNTTRGVSPDYNDSTTGNHFLLPADIAVMYDFVPANDPLIPKSIQGTTPVAVVGQSFVNTSAGSAVWDFTTLSDFGVTVPTPTPILVPGSGVEAISLGDEAESEIDLEYIDVAGGSLNPFFVFVGDNTNYSVFDSLGYAIDENLASVISISYGVCEPLLSSTELEQWNAMFEQANAQGQTIVASAGDSGATACSPENLASGVTAAEQQAPAVSFPASSPNVTAVGGTQMAAGTFAAGNTQYWESGSSGYGPATPTLLSYVPEVAWNEGSVSNGIQAGGGGTSSYFARPAWQTAVPGIPGGSFRLLPDISLQASVSNPGYLLCTDDPTFLAGEGQTISCQDGFQTTSRGPVTVGGGTSFAAPIFAGMVALLNIEEESTGQGNINPLLYSLAGAPTTYAKVFHDISAGTTSCVTGAAGCASVCQGDFAAGTGYDEATGLGSVDFNAWLAALPAAGTASLLPTETVILPSVLGSYTAGQNVSLVIGVNNFGVNNFGQGQPFPTGAVSLAIDNTLIDASLAFIPGVGTGYALVVPATTGYHLVSVTYPGDALHAPSHATYSFLAGSVEAGGSFNVVAGNVTIANGGTGTTQITVTPSGGYNGEIMWSSLNVTSSTATTPLTGCYEIAPLIVNNVSSETLTLGVGSACSASPSYRKVQKGTAPEVQSSLPLRGIYTGLLLCGCLVARRRRWRGMLPLLLVLGAVVAGPVGCGGGGSSAGSGNTGNSSSNPSTPAPATYTMTLTGKDSVNGSIVSSATFTLAVD
jgi:subtilase family serine protease